ncbi:IS21-like element helper ATPase IstB [Listeria monocytogenes]|nr:AAA family ATPase [Listeria monocytogenes]EAC7083907.1 AAA family ATPase [Listeria monocytogenes]EAD0622392.1 AAA family ATPase [Listeria monocytogenes]EAD8590489.1 AAA family ATPase [Listeria monocytogenes]EAD8591634.1 AAA family ATPase [Listeria monocytogenes]
MSQYQDLIDNLTTLKLEQIKEYLPNFLESEKTKELSTIDILYSLTERELAFRKERAEKINIKTSHFPYQKRMKDFDFDYQPSVNKRQLLDLSSLHFMERQENILFIGSSGVGKTHLATAIGMEACRQRISTYFITCNDLIQRLTRAHQENRHEALIKNYCRYKLLIIDEIGYLSVSEVGANLFFQLIAKRYESKSTIITTNIPLSKWGEVFSDPTLANAILDRLVHHSQLIKITGRSYRMKNYLLDKDVHQSPIEEKGQAKETGKN